MKTKWLLAAGVFFLAVMPVCARDENKLDPEKLVGTWSYVSGEKDGNKVDEEGLKKANVVFTKDTIKLQGEQGEFVLKYHLDTKTKPSTIAMEITEGPAGQGSKATGIIELHGDELKICYSAMGGKTPTEFAAKAGTGNHYFVLKRKK